MKLICNENEVRKQLRTTIKAKEETNKATYKSLVAAKMQIAKLEKNANDW